MTCLVRDYRDSDLDAAAALCDARRRAYAEHQPTFWRPAAGAAEVGRAFLAEQAARDSTLAVVHETGGAVDGFLLASVVDAPPVYDPGGRTCAIDDFAVRDPSLWAHAGPELLAYVARLARERGAVQCVVVTSARDLAKRDALSRLGGSVASEWYVLDVAQLAPDAR
ncbi:MAG TPA: hypothetical protein VGX28_01910 [Frankiaceae bacterium]|nr:hypothetical protein [Frankiaceae bacterium]